MTSPPGLLTSPPGRLSGSVMAGESGSSMLSAMIAIALMATAFGLGARAVWGTAGVTKQLSESARFQATLARFDAEFVLAAGRIRQPIWLAQGDVRATGNEISVSYLDGDPASQLRLRWDEQGVFLIAGNTSSVFRGLLVTQVTVDPRPPAHLTVRAAGGRHDPIAITAPFALFPLPQP